MYSLILLEILRIIKLIYLAMNIFTRKKKPYPHACLVSVSNEDAPLTPPRLVWPVAACKTSCRIRRGGRTRCSSGSYPDRRHIPPKAPPDPLPTAGDSICSLECKISTGLSRIAQIPAVVSSWRRRSMCFHSLDAKRHQLQRGPAARDSESYSRFSRLVVH